MRYHLEMRVSRFQIKKDIIMLSEAEIRVNTEQIKTADDIATIDNAKVSRFKDT